MIDINTILTQALTQALAAATAPLVERIETLQAKCAAYEILFNETRGRITALENNPAIGVDTTLERRVAALEGDISHKVQVQQANITAALAERIAALEGSKGLTRDDVESLIERSMDHHLECYDHDSYDNATSTVDDIDFDDFMRKDDSLEDAIRDTVRGMSFEIR